MTQRKTTRLHFSEEDLSDPRVKKAAFRAEAATDKADKAKERLPTRRRLRWEREGAENTLHHERQPAKYTEPVDPAKQKSQRKQVRREAAQQSKKKSAAEKLTGDIEPVKSRRGKFHFEEVDVKKPSSASRKLIHAPANVASAEIHRAASRGNEDENAGVEAAHFGESTAESTVHAAGHASYSHKLRKYRRADKLEAKADAANVEALYQRSLADNPEAASNPISRWRQKQAIKKEYAAMKAGRSAAQTGHTASGTVSSAKKASQGVKDIAKQIIDYAKSHAHILLMVLALGLIIMVIAGSISSCATMLSAGGNVVIGTSFTAETEDLIGADEDYTKLEAKLQRTIDSIERDHPGYDEYRYNLAQIGHDPYELAALLTVQFDDYTREEVQAELQRIFDAQYKLTLREEVEIRTRTVHNSSTDPGTGETIDESYEEEYEYYILHVTLTNSGVDVVAHNFSLTNDQMERYQVLRETRGNRDDLFAGTAFAVPGEYMDYDIPGEALTDEKFRNMITEAEKYLGYPYVWGGSSPSTSFDCSGFVSWVINNCGNGWRVGRQTADGLKNLCAIIPKSEAKPGDLIFFQGTYNTRGASHVGIYVGNGVMLHCGNVRPARAKVEVD